MQGVLRCSALASGAVSTVDPWPLAPGAGRAFGTTTTFPLPAASPLAAHLARALAPGATPEDADILFTLRSGSAAAAAGAPVLARAVYSLRDLVEARVDVASEPLPLVAMPACTGAAPAETVAEVVISLKGCKAVAALIGQ